ncbi:hypothetical protein MANES_02G101550v8 [Manihot esculenta]|uniref:Uncharacterized protein n=1 Tax=Manihot esculenta TaxID=3983 RepID=A0ACB7I4K7_MANES|nr:hypothetical protein MANES_02G101550v8 [Manihot esculenta]
MAGPISLHLAFLLWNKISHKAQENLYIDAKVGKMMKF